MNRLTRTEALPIARRLAAAVCEVENGSEAYCRYMREGLYDDTLIIQAAIAGLMYHAPVNVPPTVSSEQAA